MKKFVTSLLTFLIASTMLLNVSAAESEEIKYDSDTIPESIKAELGVHEGDQVIAMYNVSLLLSFMTCNNIDEVLSSDNVLEIMYRITSAGGWVTWKAKRQGAYEKLGTLNPVLEDLRATSAFQTSEVLELLPEDTQIENVYYLYSETNREGNALYYVTNHGDYIYYFHNRFENARRLFTLKEFRYHQAAKYISQKKNISESKISSHMSSLIHKYRNRENTNSANLYLWVGIPCAAVLVVVGVVLVARKKRSNPPPEE